MDKLAQFGMSATALIRWDRMIAVLVEKEGFKPLYFMFALNETASGRLEIINKGAREVTDRFVPGEDAGINRIYDMCKEHGVVSVVYTIHSMLRDRDAIGRLEEIQDLNDPYEGCGWFSVCPDSGEHTPC
jgi:hypothetical protein